MSNPFVKEMKARLEVAKNMMDKDKVFRINGILYPTLVVKPENFNAMETFEAREDDIMLATYPKCGFNWMVGMLRKIAAAAKNSAGDNPDKWPPFHPLLEGIHPEKYQSINEAPSPRLLGTHMHPDNIPSSFAEKNTKILLVLRNPKDTIVSYFHFTNKNPVLPTAESWDKFFADFMSGEVFWGSYFDHALSWEKHIDNPNIMFVTYEDLKENLSEEIKQIAKFFNFTLSEEQINTIAQESTFTVMKENSENSHGPLSNVYFRRGEVGDWKNHFSEDQSKEMDARFEKCLAGTKIGARLKYDIYCQ
ncbi:sulfotransferase 6B1 [Amia ocellicauda]|uniref:sulfotransferase 6B1 n=1 Tax=Amia ocellicauda TaxID=2972642 RepID=UPI0034641B3C